MYNLNKEEESIIKEIGFIYSDKSNLYEMEYDDGYSKDFLIIKENYFRIEKEYFMYDYDGSSYTYIDKIESCDDISLIEFLKINYEK